MAHSLDLQYTIRRNGDGYWIVMLGKAVMAKRTSKRACKAWIDLQEGKINEIVTSWQGCSRNSVYRE